MIRLISEDEFISRSRRVPLQQLSWGLAQKCGIEILIRRDDLIDKHLSGNKFYKLFYNLHAAKHLGHKQLLTFGGAYSNHLHSLAAAAKLYGFSAIGVIRGERPKQLSQTLLDAESWGMTLEFISRADYGEKSSPILLTQLAARHGDFYEIPEGGANSLGVKGAKVLGESIQQQTSLNHTSVCLACGTGNTLAGVAAGLAEGVAAAKINGQAIGFSVLKGVGDLGTQIINQQQSIARATANWRVISGYHGGGYGKKLPAYLRQFLHEFEQENRLQLDPVYTLKMFWGVAQLMLLNYWPRGSRLILIHTGGLQGRRGFSL